MKKLILSTILFSSLIVSSFCSDYVIAAEKFEYSRGQTKTAVTDATAELLPQQILSNINSQLMRSVMPDEQLERSRYESRKNRYSLYLQLSSEYKKRDALVLNNYSDSELKKQIETQNEKIKEIEDEIKENIEDQKEKETELVEKQKKFSEKGYTRENSDKTEIEKYSSLVKNLFLKRDSLVSVEGIKFYKDDKTALYTAGQTAKDAGYTSAIFEKEIVNANINALMTGKISSYGDYIFVSVTVFTYPGAKNIGTVSEVGSKDELEFLCASISRQLLPILTNSMKVAVSFEVEPNEADFQIFIDDALQNNIEDNLILDSGVHKIQIVAEGYESVSASYFFDGNEYYKINALLKANEITNLHLTLLNPVAGTIYANSIPGLQTDELVSEIQINGSTVIGNYIDENGLNSFYYIPQSKINSDDLFYVKVNKQSNDEYIDLRRKWMYAGYSSLMVSLMPTFFTNGQYQKYKSLVTQFSDSEENLKYAQNYKTAWLICSGVSIAAGIFWGEELVRYLIAADKVLPSKTQIDKNGKLAEKQAKNIIKAEKEAKKKAEKEAKAAEKQAKKDAKLKDKTKNQDENLENDDENVTESNSTELSKEIETEKSEETESEIDSSETEIENSKDELESRFKEGV